MSIEKADWWQRPWNAMIGRDEKHTIYLLHVSNLASKDAAMVENETLIQQFNSDLKPVWKHTFEKLASMPTCPILDSHLEGDVNLTLLRYLLLLHRDTLRVLPLHRGIGQYLTKEHLERLQVNFVCKYFSRVGLWESIEDHIMLDYP
jgi:hypothetical protein